MVQNKTKIKGHPMTEEKLLRKEEELIEAQQEEQELYWELTRLI